MSFTLLTSFFQSVSLLVIIKCITFRLKTTMSLIVEYVKNLNKFIPLFFKTIIVKYDLKVISVKYLSKLNLFTIKTQSL